MKRRQFIHASLASLALSQAPFQILTSASAAEGGTAPAGAKSVRIAVIGSGGRGQSLMQDLVHVPGVQIPAICDINPANLERAQQMVKEALGNMPEGYSKDAHDYRRMLERKDFDAVMIATPAQMHAEMSIDAMNAGKDVGVEVPGAYTLEECWNLVRTKEKTGRHYMLLENYNYMRDNMMIYGMSQKGLFGEPYYAECAYLHETDELNFKEDGSLTWRGELRRDSLGNWYPTHSVGPVSKWMGINDGDRFDTLVCMQSKPRMAHVHAVERFGPESPQAKIEWSTGEYITCLIYTKKGRVIRVDFGPVSPRPHQIFYGLQGTSGGMDSRLGIYLKGITEKRGDGGVRFDKLEDYHAEYESPYWRTMGEEAEKSGHGGGDYMEMHDFVNMVRLQREPWIDVYDSAAWSIIYHCSRLSLQGGMKPVEVPDFTSGKWESPDWRKGSMKPTQPV